MPGRVSRPAPALPPRPKQRPWGAARPGARSERRQVSGGFAPEPAVLGCPTSPSQPRWQSRGTGEGWRRGLPVPLAARGSAPGPGRGPSARSGRARPEPRPPERDLLWLNHTGGSSALTLGLLPPRRTCGCSGPRRGTGSRAHCVCGPWLPLCTELRTEPESRGMPSCGLLRSSACSDSKGCLQVARGDRMLLSAS